MNKLRIINCFALAFLLVLPAVAAPIRIGIVETQDAYTNILGLAAMLDADAVTYVNFSTSFENGVVPNLSNIDTLILGSFITRDAEKKATYLAAGATLASFVENGGTVILLTQADQDTYLNGTAPPSGEVWLPEPHRLERADPDFGTAYVMAATHVLLTSPETLLPANLTGWRAPSTWGADNTIWEAYTEFREGRVILAGASSGGAPGLIEMEWGTGRALFYAMPLDKAFQGGNTASHDGAIKLMRNALNYAQLVEDGVAPPLELTPSGAYDFPIRGTVYMDTNHNGQRDPGEPGRAGIGVSDGVDVVLTDATGEYTLPNTDGAPPFLYVTQPNDVVKSATNFYQFLSAEDGENDRFDFGLWPAGSVTTGATFAQVTDVHTANGTDRQLQLDSCTEIFEMQPPPDFVISTGDLVNTGSNLSEYENYLPSVLASPLPFFNVLGNHDVDGSSSRVDNFRYYFGPDYYSFDHGGIHFVVRNVIVGSARQDAWLQEDLSALSAGQPVVFFQHFPPTAAELAQLDGWNVHSVYTGHWHSEKAVKSATTTSVNSPTLVMGGIDCSPAGFQLVNLAADGGYAKEWRYGGQDRRAVVVSPAPGSQANRERFPIIANVYDTSVKVRSVDWTLTSFSQTVGTGSLVQESPWNWSGAFDAGGQFLIGAATLRVDVTDVAGATWTVQSDFSLDTKTSAVPQPDGSWPMFMGGPEHPGSATPSFTMPLRLAWSVPTGGDLDFSSPILAEGKLFLALKARTTDSQNGLIAIDPANGDILWRFETPQAINHTPAYQDGILCICEVGGRVYGVSSVTGLEVWRHDLLDPLGRYIYAAPAAEGGKFYVGSVNRFARLNAETGVADWEKRIATGGSTDWIAGYGSPVVSGNTLAMGGMWTSGNDLLVMNKATGDTIWSHAADNGMHGSPSIVDGKILFPSNTSRLYCYTLAGVVQWNVSVGTGWSATTPAVKGGVVVAGSGDGRMRAYQVADGSQLWVFDSEPALFQISPYRRDWVGLLSSPTISGDKVYFGSSDGYLYCLAMSNGSVLWKLFVGVPILSTPLVSGNAVFVGAYDGRLYAFTPDTEATQGATPTPTNTPTVTPTGTPTQTPTPTNTPDLTDVNRDLWIDAKDVFELARVWMRDASEVSPPLQLDWDNSGVVDQGDLLYFADRWSARRH